MIRRLIFGTSDRRRWIPAVLVQGILGPAGRRSGLAAGATVGPILVAALVVASAAFAQGLPSTDGPGAYTVLLESPSVGERLRESASSKQASPLPRRDAATVGFMRRAVALAQAPVVDLIEAEGGQVLGSARHVLNAVFVHAMPGEAEAIRNLPGVSAVVPSRRHEPMVMGVSDIVNVSAARMRPVGSPLNGEGMKIAIIDSGLDFEHAAFQDDSLTPIPGYPKGDPAYLDYATNKVISVRSYVEMLNSKNPDSSTPDDYTPRDIGGHGTSVAMVAAGASVETDLGEFSGIAPKARIGVYKVFGTPGVNFYTADHAVIAAIDDAILDGMDILNLSLGHLAFWKWDSTGRDCGQSVATAECDPLAAAAQNAVVDFGKVVVVAAGNEGLRGSHELASLNTVNSPGNAPAVITVGGIGNAYSDFRESVQVGSQSFAALGGSGPAPDGPLTASVQFASDLGDALGCEPYAAAALEGDIVIVDRGDCFFQQKVEHADAAGAVGVLVINDEGDDLVAMAQLGDTDIPAFFIGASDGETLHGLLAEADNVVTLDPTPVVEEQEWNYVWPSTGRGPTLSLYPKPDLAAPAQLVYTAVPRYNDQGNLFAPGGFAQLSGTSFAAPIVAGAAALVWQAHPSLNARQVSSALINSADAESVLEDDVFARLASVGAGVLDIQAAIRAVATAVPSSVGFGSVGNVALPVRRTLVIANNLQRTESFQLHVEARDSDLRARVMIDGSRSRRLRLAPSGSIELEITLTGTRPPPGSYEGRLKLTGLGGSGNISIPYLYVVGDNEPYNTLPIQGQFATGVEGERTRQTVVARVTDQFGAPVANRPVTFAVTEGSGWIESSTSSSGSTGLIFARVRYGPEADLQSVVATIGDLDLTFNYEAIATVPEISSIHNAASESSAQGVAPGSLVTIRGSGFADYASGPPQGYQTGRLAITRKGVSVTFDSETQGVSAPGGIFEIGEDWVTVQVPWELAGWNSGFVKVRSAENSEPFIFQLASADPGIFSYDVDGQAMAWATVSDGLRVSADAPAPRGAEVTFVTTGNGPVVTPPPSGEASEVMVETVETPVVRIGGVATEVTYSGLNPGTAGLYLVTAIVPESLQPGTHAVQVIVNSATSNIVRLPVQ